MKNYLDRINEDAQDRFKKLRSKMQLDLQAPAMRNLLIQMHAGVKELLDDPKGDFTNIEVVSDKIAPKSDEAIKAIRFVDDSFSFIESLSLPPQLS